MNTEPAATSPKTTSLGRAAPAVKPKTAKHPVVIYAFHCTEGSRGVYVGKHEVRKGDPRQWPSSGVGKLPSGYGGSGNWVKNARAKYGHDAFRWCVLEVVEPGQDYANAEARAVAAAREEFGVRCKNIQNGGDGFDSEAGRMQNLERWRDAENRVAMHRNALQKRLTAATRRRNLGQPPRPLDNLCLSVFNEARNPLPSVLPLEPGGKIQKAVLEALRRHPEGLTVPELCESLGRPEFGLGGGVRNALDNLRNCYHQPILNEEGVFRILPEGSY